MNSPSPSLLLCSLVTAFGCTRTEPAAPADAPSSAPPALSTSADSPHRHGDGAGHGPHASHARHDAHGPLGHRFEHAEEWTGVFDDPQRDTWQMPAEVVRIIDVAKGATVADVGAGTGYFLPWLSRAVGPTGTVVAVDIEPDMVRYLRERAKREGLDNVRAVRGLPTSPSLPTGAVDCILIVNTWHHIPDRITYVKKLRDALREAGKVVVVDYTLESPTGPPREHRIAPEQVERELRSGGLAANRVQEPLPLQYVVVARR